MKSLYVAVGSPPTRHVNIKRAPIHEGIMGDGPEVGHYFVTPNSEGDFRFANQTTRGAFPLSIDSEGINNLECITLPQPKMKKIIEDIRANKEPMSYGHIQKAAGIHCGDDFRNAHLYLARNGLIDVAHPLVLSDELISHYRFEGDEEVFDYMHITLSLGSMDEGSLKELHKELGIEYYPEKVIDTQRRFC